MTPQTEQELAEAVASAKGPLHIKGGGTRPIGNPMIGAALSTRDMSGITLYEPGALTLVAKAGTPLSDIEATLAAENQRLAFEPMDHRVLLGTQGTPTIGGVVAANVSGARRIAVGACRDHLLGLRFVDGNGTIIKNGGRVMKNVTGYDLVKLLAGSYGTLGVISEVSLKVLPILETSATLMLHDLSLQDSVAAMSTALGSPFEITGAALYAGQTCLRIEGFAASVDYRFDQLKTLLGSYGEITRVDHDDSAALWQDITNVAAFHDHTTVSRVSIKPSAAANFATTVRQTTACDIMLDWGGGLMWFGMTPEHARSATTDHSLTADASFAQAHQELQRLALKEPGHATLIKAPETVKHAAPVFQPQEAGIAQLSTALRARFDPRGILNPGLMGA